MWDKPALLNAAATALFALAALLVLAAIAVYAARLPQFSLREVRIAGELKHVTREQVEDVVRREVHGGFFTVNLNTARDAFERMPWVRGANLRREWPHTTVICRYSSGPKARRGRSRSNTATSSAAWDRSARRRYGSR